MLKSVYDLKGHILKTAVSNGVVGHGTTCN